MFKLENILANEYFPQELPPCFNSKMIAENVEDIKKWITSCNPKHSIPLIYSGYKNENSRRRFAVPNIFHYFKAACCIVDYSQEIIDITSSSHASLSAPIDKPAETNRPYCKKSNSIQDTKKEIESLYQNNMYCCKLDIEAFFDSVYTHTISWAMHTQKVAKNSKEETLIGGQLDIAVRAMNYSQTNGILVGNAISRIISEIILCTVDKEIQKQFPNLKYRRFVDDYTIFFEDASEIQHVISFIRNQLGKFELALNENKIEITQSPFLYGKMWVEEIKLFLHLDSEVFLNKAISLFSQYKDISILRYALTVISFHDIKKDEWSHIESKILNLWVRFPSLADLILEILFDKKDYLHKSNVKEAIYAVLNRCIPLSQDQEVIWAVWFAKVFSVQLNKQYVIKVLESNNQLAKIILLDMISSNTIEKSADVLNALEDLLNQLYDSDLDENQNSGNLMWTENWLLAYEADLNKWLNSENKDFNLARSNVFFKCLIKKKIKFYDTSFSYLPKQKKTLQYVTRDEFYTYVKKVNQSLLKETDSKGKDNKILFDVKNLQQELIGKIESKAFNY